MPRYCAVKLCKNRGGVLSKDNKRISFYPFPLRDQARLQKWVDNMKRQEWTPSRHQYLCSEHFTEDSFDFRWGIRYLKHTAIPTIFPYICDEANNRIPNRKNPRITGRAFSTGVQLIRSMSPPRKKTLVLTDNNFCVSSSSSSSPGKRLEHSVSSPAAVEVKAEHGQVFSMVLMGKLKMETPVYPLQEVRSQTRPNVKQTSSPSQVHVSGSEASSCGRAQVCRSDGQAKQETEEPTCVSPAVMAVPRDPCADRTSGMDTTKTTTAATVVLGLGTGMGTETGSLQKGHTGHQGIAIAPIVCLQAVVKQQQEQEGEEEGLVTSETLTETETEERPERDEVAEAVVEVELEVGGEDEQEQEHEHAYLCEHSYSRQDLDEEQLWGRIAALHAKITELDQREGDTLAKIQAAEAELVRLRKQSIVCEEKHKMLEEYFTSVFLP